MADATIIDPTLKKWATPRQSEYIDAVIEHGSVRAAAKALGISHTSILNKLKSVKKRAAISGYSPEHGLTEEIAPGYSGRGHSTMYKVDPATGEKAPLIQWVKTKADDLARNAMFEAAVKAMSDDIPRLPPIPPPAQVESKLCNLFTITDYHVGMMAWAREGGDKWDLEIAEETLVKAFSRMIASRPKARVAVVNQLGDFLHFDGPDPVTPTNRHVLDPSARFREMIEVAVRLLRRVVDMTLATHEEVHLVVAEGNHDILGGAWLQIMFSALYENEPRVTVNDSDLPFYAYRHGRVMLGFHHGHTKKNDSLPLHFAASFPSVWGSTTKRYIHVGHRHHVEEKEHSGAKVVQHSTLAARDAYAARGGWISDRQAVAITYHEDHGEVERSTVTPGML